MKASSILVDASRHALARLVDELGFEEPEAEAIGRETFVRFHRGDRTVSIAFEPGSSPTIELFYPVEGTDDDPVPWAERNGVARARRIPRLNVRTKPYRDEATLKQSLKVLAKALFDVEADWLAR